MNGLNTVVSREVSWFTTDPCPTFVTAPPQLLHRSRSISDGVLGASSLIVTSATANFTTADIGSTIVGGAIPGSATIVSLNTASSINLSASSTASSTGTSLTIDNGAPFDAVQGHFTKVPQRQRWLFITTDGESRDELMTMQEREVVYPMLLTVFWSFESGTGSLETEQQNLENAVNSILLRLRGPLGSKSHNSNFLTVAAGGPEGDGRITVRLLNAYEQVVNRQPLGAEIRYLATDWFPSDPA